MASTGGTPGMHTCMNVCICVHVCVYTTACVPGGLYISALSSHLRGWGAVGSVAAPDLPALFRGPAPLEGPGGCWPGLVPRPPRSCWDHRSFSHLCACTVGATSLSAPAGLSLGQGTLHTAFSSRPASRVLLSDPDVTQFLGPPPAHTVGRPRAHVQGLSLVVRGMHLAGSAEVDGDRESEAGGLSVQEPPSPRGTPPGTLWVPEAEGRTGPCGTSWARCSRRWTASDGKGP